jgi:hypothetical protein
MKELNEICVEVDFSFLRAKTQQTKAALQSQQRARNPKKQKWQRGE